MKVGDDVDARLMTKFPNSFVEHYKTKLIKTLVHQGYRGDRLVGRLSDLGYNDAEAAEIVFKGCGVIEGRGAAKDVPAPHEAKARATDGPRNKNEEDEENEHGTDPRAIADDIQDDAEALVDALNKPMGNRKRKDMKLSKITKLGRGLFKSAIFPPGSTFSDEAADSDDGNTYRPIGATDLASRMMGEEEEFVRPAVREFDVSGRNQPRPASRQPDDIGDLMGAWSESPANRHLVDDTETRRRHVSLNPWATDRRAAHIGGEEVTYRPGLVESEGDGTMYVLRDGLEPRGIPTRVPGSDLYLTPSETQVIPDSPKTPNFRVAKSKDTMRTGTFTDAIFGQHGDSADSRLG